MIQASNDSCCSHDSCKWKWTFLSHDLYMRWQDICCKDNNKLAYYQKCVTVELLFGNII